MDFSGMAHDFFIFFIFWKISRFLKAIIVHSSYSYYLK